MTRKYWPCWSKLNSHKSLLFAVEKKNKHQDLFLFDRYMSSIYGVRVRCNSLHDGCGWYQCTLNPVGASVHKSTHSHLGVSSRKYCPSSVHCNINMIFSKFTKSPKKEAGTAITPNCIVHEEKQKLRKSCGGFLFHSQQSQLEPSCSFLFAPIIPSSQKE